MKTLKLLIERAKLRLMPLGIVLLTALDYFELYFRRTLVVLLLVATGVTIVCGGALLSYLIVDLIAQNLGA